MTDTNSKSSYQTTEIKQARLALRAIDHKLRSKMLQYIEQWGEVNVTQLYCSLRLEQSVTSQHLAILRKAGCVKTRREGKEIYYSVHHTNIGKLQGYAQLMADLAG